MHKRFLRIYVLMTSLSLIAGTALGHWSGQKSTESDLANDCEQQGVFVVYDPDSDAHRHFHCFEVQDLEDFKEPAPPPRPEYEV